MYLGFSPLSESLPVFRRLEAGSALYYAPGFVLRASETARPALEAELADGEAHTPLIVALLQRARSAVARRAALAARPYEPLCLTLYLDNRCNLRCAYCYSDPAAGQANPAAPLRLEAVRRAAEMVAQNCRARGLPFTVVFHGGGEPTLDPRLLRGALEVVDETAANHAQKSFKYLATNGVMPAERARWVAAHFDLVGLSCDGPAQIQNRQRPRVSGKGSAFFVERTADVLREMDRPFHVRVTVTPDASARQEEIIDYVCARLVPLEIHLEPVYTGGREQQGFAAAENLAETFVAHFLQAQALARSAGIPLQFSGSRPWDVHGPFCQVFRDVLQLVPGEVASPCFKLSDASQVDALDARIGWDTEEGFLLDREKIQALRQRLEPLPDPCRACFNQYHCARGCPDGCGLESVSPGLPNFRCEVQMRLAWAVIERAASALVVSDAAPLAASPIRMDI